MGKVANSGPQKIAKGAPRSPKKDYLVVGAPLVRHPPPKRTSLNQLEDVRTRWQTRHGSTSMFEVEEDSRRTTSYRRALLKMVRVYPGRSSAACSLATRWPPSRQQGRGLKIVPVEDMPYMADGFNRSTSCSIRSACRRG